MQKYIIYIVLIYISDGLLDCSKDTSIIIVHIFTLVTNDMPPTKKVKLAPEDKKGPSKFEPLTLRLHGQLLTCYPTTKVGLSYIDRDWYVSVRTNRRLDRLTKTKTEPVAGRRREHDRGRPRQSRDGQGEARRANITSKGGPHLELGRLPLKTWSNSDFSIAETTWPTYLCIYLIYSRYQVSCLVVYQYHCRPQTSQQVMAVHYHFSTSLYCHCMLHGSVRRPSTSYELFISY